MIKVSIFLLSFVLTTTLSIAKTNEGFHKGRIIHKNGIDYEVVLTSNEVKVFADPKKTTLPNKLTLKLKNKKQKIQQISLVLTPQKEPNEPSYSGQVPANITISGVVKLEIDF